MPKMRHIHQIPIADRPREKLIRKGAQALSDFELLEVLIGSGTAGMRVEQIARRLQKILRREHADLRFETLTTVKGVSTAGAGKILAALELAKRHLLQNVEPLLSQQSILAQLTDIRAKQQEYFICLSLDGGQRLIMQRTITIGVLDSVQAHPREVFADAIADRAASIIIAHNHPSGNPQPTSKDIMLTQQLAGAGQLLGIPLRDHIIVTKTDQFSYRQHHLL